MNKKDMFIREKLQQDKIISDKANKIFDNIKEEFRVENNEKKIIKISLGTFIAIAASLVIVGFVGINLYANSIGKPNIISGIQALIKNETEVNVDDIAKELFKKGAYEIRKLEYSSFVKDEYQVEGDFIEKEIKGRLYVKTNEKFETVEQKYAEIFTEDALKNVLSRRFANVDGVLYVSHGGATGWDITNIEVEKINEENGELTYRASYNDVNIDESISKEKYNCEFKIKQVNGEYRISETNYCNLDKKQEKIEDNITNNNLDIETARSVIQSYLNIIGAKEGSPIEALAIEEIGLIDRYSEIPGGDKVDKEGYRSSNINYEDFKNKMLQYMTEELFNKISGYKNVNGKLHIFNGGATGIGFDIKEISLVYSNEKSYRYSIKVLEYPPEEGMNCLGEVQLQKNKDGKYVVSALVWILVNEPENNVDNNNSETLGSNQNILLGDVNCDGEIDIKDVVYLRQYIEEKVNLSEEEKANADVNDDEIITQGDVDILRKYLVEEISELPYKKQEDNNSGDYETIDKNQNRYFGDVDLDGEVTDWDEIYLTRYLNNWDGYDLSENAKLNADVNDDGIITQEDVEILKKYLAGWDIELPYST